MKTWIKISGLLLMLPVAVNAAKYGDFTYTISGGTITITQYTGTNDTATIPNTINGLPVTGIGEQAFGGRGSLINVIIPDNVTSIGSGAFGNCENLIRITIPNSVTNIGDFAFTTCTSLNSVTIIGNITSIGAYAFFNCFNLISVYFQSAPPVLGSWAFSGDEGATVYRLSGAAGWPTPPDEWGGRPTALWDIVVCPLTIDGGSGSGLYTNQQRVAISANAETGKIFDRWTGDTQYIENATSLRTIVIMPEHAITLTATYKDIYTLTVYDGNGGSSGSGSYTNQQRVTISAGTPATWELFDRWTGDTQYMDSVTSSTTTVTMPASNITVVATYKDIYFTLTVNSGTGGGSYVYQQRVAISANAQVGQSFDRWSGATQYVDFVTFHNPTVTMPASNITVTATYKAVYYSLTITGGSGGGSYTNQRRVTIWANAPAPGKAFDRWIGTTQYVANVTSSTTTVTMPASNIAVIATYKDVYMLSVSQGTGGGSYTNQQRVTISANAQVGQSFDRWSGATQYVANVTSSTTTVTMPASNITVTATYKAVYYSLTITGGSGSGSYTNQQRVTISASAPAVGKTFQWTGDRQYVANVTSLITTVTMPASNITVVATYKDIYFTLTVNSGTGSGSYVYQQQVEISANDPAVGKIFDRWTGDTQYVASVTSSAAIVTIPATNIVVTATYKVAYYTLTVSNGSGGGSYTNQQRVTITANVPSGYIFDRWIGDTQCVENITSSITTVTMPAQGANLTATYEPLARNVTVSQRPGTKLVDITYDLFSPRTNAVPVVLRISNVTNLVNPTNLTGDVGTRVTTGIGKSIVWNMGTDWNGNTASEAVFTVTVCLSGGDPSAVDWESVGGGWIKNFYANGDITMSGPNGMWLCYIYPVPTQPYDFGNTNWAAARTLCDSMTYAGYSDWRLPDLNTLEWQWQNKNYFPDMPRSAYWSDTTDDNFPSKAYYVNIGSFYGGNDLVGTSLKTDNSWYVWPVRSPTSSFAPASNSASIDARDYQLFVSSAYGTPIPVIGTNLYAWGSTVTCSVQSTVSGLANGICSGWRGTGDVCSSGNGNTTVAILLSNLTSSIIWTWVATVSDLWSENMTATQRPGTKLVDISYGVFSTKTNSVEVSLAVLNGTNTVNASTVSGAVGAGITTGAVKTIVWNAGADWNGNVSNLTIRILGQDAQGAGTATPAGKVRIPAGQNTGTDPDSGAYSITVTNAFFMDATEVTKAQWDVVYSWALTNGYSFTNVGSGKATNHPVQMVNWYDCVKWCNARSQMDGWTPCYTTNGVIYKTGQNTNVACNVAVTGYRLPTSPEWEYAACGGLSGKRFPWGDTITHSNDNYYSDASYSYDVSTTRGFHPVYGAGTAPEGTGTTNGYGLYAMSGNVMEWCQDTSGVSRAMCGGSWDQYASEARCTYKSWAAPTTADYNIGFRTVQRASSSTSADSGTAVPVDTRDYQLIVSSARGTPVPNIGTNLYAWRATVTGSVNSAVTSGLTNWTSAGWSGAGSVPVSGVSTNTGGIMLTGLVSSIVWNWNTNYWLEVIKSGSGSVSPTNGWRPAGTNLLLTVSPSNGWLFMGWSGDASGDYTATNIIVPIVRPVSVTATFSDDADGDGLLNTNETALGTDPRKKDTDGDGMNDPQELIAGTSPTNSASVLAVKLSTDVSANQVSWYGVSGRYYRLEYTDDLANGWTPKGTVSSGANAQIMKLDIPSGGKRFYRIRVSNSPTGF